jgi:NitT/TauT family transport system ATP-binding protein
VRANAAVAVSAVSKVFDSGAGDRVEALQNIDLTIAGNEFISLIGPSGCGKSTLLRLAGDLLQPTVGTVEVNGKPAHQARLDREYGMVFQQATLLEWRTVARNVQLPLEVMNVAKDDRERRAAELLDLVQLSEFADHYPWQLSGGMQQRVAICRMLIADPEVLLLDEPFGALDEMTRERMNVELASIVREQRKAAVLVTHNVAEALFLADRVVVMTPRPGRIAGIVDVPLERPRSLDLLTTDQFQRLVREVREVLEQGYDGEGSP